MKRESTRHFIIGSLVMVLLLFSARGVFAERPNVVMILSDDQAWTDYGFMGNKEIETPCLDRLAAEGATYTRGYVPTALCRPSLATMATGRYPYEHKICSSDPVPRNDPELHRRIINHIDTYPTLPKLLGEAGYVSLQTGKWWEGNPVEHGFTQGMTKGFPHRGGRHGDVGLKIGRKGLGPIPGFIEQAAKEKKPFFLWYAPFMPHEPHTPPADILAKYQKPGRPEVLAKYYAMCDWFDQTCCEVLDLLKKEGVADNTIVVYVCDNGWVQQFPGVNEQVPGIKSPKGWPFPFTSRSKLSPYDYGTRTPIMVKWPAGGVKPKLDRETLVSSIDLVPTILDACNVKAPEGLPGKSLLADARGVKPLDRDTVYGEQHTNHFIDVDRPEMSLMYRWVIEGPWKLLLVYDSELGTSGILRKGESDEPKLYNLIDDPYEEHNVAASHPEIVQRLAEKIQRWYPLSENAPKMLSKLPK